MKSPAKSTQAVLTALQALSHATAQEIMDWVNAQGKIKKLSLTSTYRALNTLLAEHRVKPLHFHDGSLRYEFIKEGGDHHHHAICTQCNRIEEVPHCPAGPALADLPEGFMVQYHNFEVFGLCQQCQLTPSA
jgi:Fur family zinc uptake transcriptional regulator